jgi:uncharacterized protein (DUF849 family)
VGVRLQACLNGARLSGVPVTAAELAAAAVGAVDAGADGVHVHPKGADGHDTLEPAVVEAVLSAVRAAVPGAPVSVTTGAWAADGDRRTALVAGWATLPARPDAASVNWHEDGAPRLAALLLDLGIGVEAGLWTTDAARAFAAWPRRREVTRVLVEATADDPDAALAQARAIVDALGAPPAPLLVHGEESGAWPVLRWAAERALAVRIGLEDTLHLPDGSPARTSAPLVAAAVNAEPLRHNTLNPVTTSVERVTGPGGVHRVRKRLSRAPLPGRPPDRHGDDPGHAAHWAREAEVYRDPRLREQLRAAGLDLPEARVLDTPDGVTLWLEDVAGLPGTAFGVADHTELARALGRWQARPAPVPAWGSRGWLRAHLGWRLGPAELALLADDAAWEVPLVRETWPPGLRDGWRRLVAEAGRLLAAVEGAPRCTAHLDLWVNNVVRRLDGAFVLLDWAHAGDGAVGEDPGNHVPDAFLDLFTPIALLDELEAAVTRGYLAGLREGGADAARAAAAHQAMMAGAVKYAWLVPRMLQQAAQQHAQQDAYGGGAARAYFADVDARELYRARGVVFERLVAWADAALEQS